MSYEYGEMIDSGSAAEIIDGGCIEGGEVKGVYADAAGEEEEESRA